MASQKDTAQQKSARRRSKPSQDDLERMVEEAIVDANGESEPVTGYYTMLENDLELPFNTVVLGAEVTVEQLDLTNDDHIVVVCRRGQKRQRLSILDLPLSVSPDSNLEAP